MPSATPPPWFEEIQQEELGRTFGKIVGLRLVIAPVVGAALLALGIWEPTPWRRALLLLGVLAIVGISALEVRRYRRQGLRPGAIAFNLGLAVFAIVLLSAGTGTLESPLLVLMIPIALVTGVFVTGRVRAAMTLAFVLSVWVFAAAELFRWRADLIPELFGGGARAGHGELHLVTSAVVMTLAIGVATGVGQGLRHVFDTMLRRALEAREESLRAHAERARELTALSGEIAHELKNPLASAKGLAALLARELPDGRNAERLGVLRREIDRMQGILEEFLNFSRPQVPLELSRAGLGRLCEEVVALHEGMAHERGLDLELTGGGAAARCDPRKIKQVLINLVQNAIEASPAGALVEVEVGEREGVARVRVLDRGPGLDPAVAERVFEPGMTSKPRGSGLGLTIARALARQHGGELALRGREGGGCEAVLELPVDGAPGPTEPATGVSA